MEAAKGTKKSTFADLDRRDEIARQSEHMARKSLNALSVTSSIVNALVQHPGPGSDHTFMVSAAKAMLEQADGMSQQLLTHLGLDAIPWAKYRLMRMTTEAVAGRWIATAKVKGSEAAPDPNIATFLPVWLEMARHELPTFQFDEPPDDERVMMQICVLDAMQPVLQEIAAFDMFHNHAKAAMHAKQQILEAANQAMAELLPADASRRAHAQLLQGLLRNAGTAYASNWRRCAGDLVEELLLLSVSDQERAVAQHPDGWPLVKIDEGFREIFAKLTDMVAFLAQPGSVPDVSNTSQHKQAPGKTSPSPTGEREGKDSDESGRVGRHDLPSSGTSQNIRPVSVPDSILSEVVATEDMDDPPFWTDDGPEKPSDADFDSTANMVEPAWDARSDSARGADSPLR